MNSTRYNLVMYDREILTNFLGSLLLNRGKNVSQVKWAYILHDRDIIEETGEIKKPHYHIFLQFPDNVKSNVIEKILTASGSNASALSHDKTNNEFLAYLTHSTKGAKIEKALYDFEEIETNFETEEFKVMYLKAVEKASKPSRQEIRVEKVASAFSSLVSIIQENEEIISFSQLCIYLSLQEENELLEFAISKAYAIKNAFYDAFLNNRLRYSSSKLKNENLKQLEENKTTFAKIQNMHYDLSRQEIQLKELEELKNEK